MVALEVAINVKFWDHSLQTFSDVHILLFKKQIRLFPIEEKQLNQTNIVKFCEFFS